MRTCISRFSRCILYTVISLAPFVCADSEYLSFRWDLTNTVPEEINDRLSTESTTNLYMHSFMDGRTGHVKLHISDSVTPEQTRAASKNNSILISEVQFSDLTTNAGWSSLVVREHTFNSFSSQLDAAFSAGALEGFASAHRIAQFANRLRGMGRLPKTKNGDKDALHTQRLSVYAGRMVNILDQHLSNVLKSLANNKSSDKGNDDPKTNLFDTEATLSIARFFGLFAGYSVRSLPEVLSLTDLYLINVDGESGELVDALSALLRQNTANNTHADGAGSIDSIVDVCDAVLSASTSALPQSSGASAFVEIGQQQHSLSGEAYLERVRSRGRCSALVKPLWSTDDKGRPIINDVLFGHATWSPFDELVRSTKVYQRSNYSIMFSSFPGCVSSSDDFIIRTDKQWALMETTIPLLKSQRKSVSHLCQLKNSDKSYNVYPQFVTSMAAIHSAESLADWMFLMQRRSIGTYSAQWMALDYAKVQKAVDAKQTSLYPSTFLVGELVPDRFRDTKRAFHLSLFDESRTLSASEFPGIPIDDIFHLNEKPENKPQMDVIKQRGRRSFWPSANVPWYRETRQLTGHSVAATMFEDLQGEALATTPSSLVSIKAHTFVADNNETHLILQASQQNNPRTLLFKLYAPLVTSLETFAGLLTRVEPIVDGKCMDSFVSHSQQPPIDFDFNDPAHAIAARFDQRPRDKHFIKDGAMDAKVISLSLMKEHSFYAKAGPSKQIMSNDNKSWEFVVENPFDSMTENIDATEWSWVKVSPERPASIIPYAMFHAKPITEQICTSPI